MTWWHFGVLSLSAKVLMFAGIASGAGFRGPEDPGGIRQLETNEAIRNRESSAHVAPSYLMIRAYQRVVGPTKGQDCPMSPSCSHYGLEAFRCESSTVAFLMVVDRLNRCGHDLRQYPVVITEGKIRRYDPVKSVRP
jgi:putative component of membrane protein insertase Oxa1/YidC/SpoIIIJ protein YidD